MTEPGLTIAEDDLFCPFCESTEDVIMGSVMQTDVGYWPEGPEYDGNHYTGVCQCQACYHVFTKEWVPRSKAVWYAAKKEDGLQYLVHGKVGCCEGVYRIPCPCGGWLHYKSPEKTRQLILVEGGTTVEPKGEYVCDKCEESVESPH